MHGIPVWFGLPGETVAEQSFPKSFVDLEVVDPVAIPVPWIIPLGRSLRKTFVEKS